VLVKHHPRAGYVFDKGVLVIDLPVEGPRNLAPMIALATASYGVPVVPPSTTGFLLNALALRFFDEDNAGLGNPVTHRRLHENRRGAVIPEWAAGLVIRKYAAPAKVTGFRKYAAKVEAAIAAAERRVQRYTDELNKAQRSLDKAHRDLKKHQARLKSAKDRRGL